MSLVDGIGEVRVVFDGAIDKNGERRNGIGGKRFTTEILYLSNALK